MTIIELKEQIIKGNMSNFYIFTGYEIGIMNIYLKQMSNKLSLPITRASSVQEVYGKCQGNSLFGNETGFYVIRYDNDFPKHEEAYTTIQTTIGKNVIVLLYDKIDSRLKFGKFFKDNIVAFEKLTPNVLKSYIQREIPLNEKNIETLMEVCGGSYDMCMLEIDKIKNYNNNIPIDAKFSKLLNSGVIYQPEETDVFKFTDAVCSKNLKLAATLEKVLRENNISSVTTLGTLYNSMKSVLLIQCCSSSNIKEVTGLDGGQIYYNKKYVGKYSLERLVTAVKLISSTIDGIKSGRIEDEYATRYVLAMI